MQAHDQITGVIAKSSAGLRQPLPSPYPCPAIMGLAADFGADIRLASDAPTGADVGAGLADVARYARSFGFRCDTLPLRRTISPPGRPAGAGPGLSGRALPRLRFAL